MALRVSEEDSFSHRLSIRSNAITFTDVKAFEDLKIVKRISEQRYAVYLTHSPSQKKYFVMKVFPYVEGPNGEPGIDPQFQSEVLHGFLAHQNVLNIVDAQAERESTHNKRTKKFSYILTELAPYGNFWQFIMKDKMPQEEKLARTYFHQLIEGLQYLHSHSLAHNNLTLESLLLGNDYLLKIGSFGCITKGYKEDIGEGNSDYRPPEIKSGVCRDPFKADIYTAGIILFLFVNFVFPYSEDINVGGMDLYEFLMNQTKKYFVALRKAYPDVPETSEEFKELFLMMVKLNPAERPNFEQIKLSKWYQGPVYSRSKLKSIMKGRVVSMIKEDGKHCCNIF